MNPRSWRRVGRALLAIALAATALGVAPAGAQEPGCTLVVTQDTTLDRDLSCPDVAIEIGAPGITLDLGGHQVSSGAEGIRNQGFDGVTIRNGSVSADGVAVELAGAERNVIRDLKLFTALQSTIRLVGSDHNRILGNDSVGYRTGIDLRDGSDRNLVARNYDHGSLYGGMRVTDSARNLIVDNELATRETAPLVLTRAGGNLVAGNRVSGQYTEGIALRGSNRNRVIGNRIAAADPAASPTPPAGLAVAESDRNRIARNAVSDHVAGLSIASGRGNLLARNRAFDNEGDGILVAAGALRTALYANRATGNGDDGIDVESPSSWLVRNLAARNGDLGIEAVPGVRGWGNRAAGNANAAQCLNVRCR